MIGMDYYIFDGRIEKDRNPWNVSAESLPYMLIEVEDTKRFRNTQFLMRLFGTFNAATMALCMDMPDKKRIAEVEKHLSVDSRVSTGFLTFMEYTESNAKLLLDTSELLGKWEEWAIGFLEESAAEQVLERCKRDEYPIGPLVGAGISKYLVIRNFDYERLSLFAFQEQRFDEFQSFVVRHLELTQGLRFHGSY